MISVKMTDMRAARFNDKRYFEFSSKGWKEDIKVIARRAYGSRNLAKSVTVPRNPRNNAEPKR